MLVWSETTPADAHAPKSALFLAEGHGTPCVVMRLGKGFLHVNNHNPILLPKRKRQWPIHKPHGIAVIALCGFLLVVSGFVLGWRTAPQAHCPAARPFEYYFREDSANQPDYPPAPNEFYPGEFVPGFHYILGRYYNDTSKGRWLSFGQIRQLILRFYQKYRGINHYYSGFDSDMRPICHQIILRFGVHKLCGTG